MNKLSLTKTLVLFGATVIIIGALSGCGKITPVADIVFPSEIEIIDDDVAKNDNIKKDLAVAAADAVYEDANGWKVNYNPDIFVVNHFDNNVSFVYMSEGVGTNMVVVTYDVGMNAKEVIAKMAESWGDENVYKSQGVFPGTEDVNSYYVVLPPTEGGSGFYESAIARDYKDGYLLFDVIGHDTGDELRDMEVGDALAMIIDSAQLSNT